MSFLPFMAGVGWDCGDMLNQITLLQQHCSDPSGLLVHGYDYNKTAVWANPITGASPYVWGRSLGWYLSGLVNTYDVFGMEKTGNGSQSNKTTIKRRPEDNFIETIRVQMTNISVTLVGWADPTTGAWWQLPTFPEREGNYLESSSTALFVFALLKAARLGMIPADAVTVPALRADNYTRDSRNFLLKFANGTLGYDKTVSVCSLNSTATYEYYTTRPLLPNSLLGEAAFVLASLEVERLL